MGSRSSKSVSPLTRLVLWARGAGRCYICNRSLIGDLESGAEDRNFGFVAHIVAEMPGGPRGDPIRSPLLVDDVNNLMLLCHVHHKLIDVDQAANYPEERLQEIKRSHEVRIATLADIRPDRGSHVLRYAANIGDHQAPITYDEVAAAMLPERYPAEGRRMIDIELRGSSLRDADTDFWKVEQTNLRRAFEKRVSERIEDRVIQHLSIFALAPQPLLIELGRLVGDIFPAAVHQRLREPAGWRWSENGPPLRLEMKSSPGNGPSALVIGLSATVDPDRVRRVLGRDASIWEVQAVDPHNDIVRQAADLVHFRRTIRLALDRIKAANPHARELHLFPAMPVSTAVELGRAWMPKADLPLVIYDENRVNGGFVRALSIN